MSNNSSKMKCHNQPNMSKPQGHTHCMVYSKSPPGGYWEVEDLQPRDCQEMTNLTMKHLKSSSPATHKFSRWMTHNTIFSMPAICQALNKQFFLVCGTTHEREVIFVPGG